MMKLEDIGDSWKGIPVILLYLVGSFEGMAL
jgi:hypothetical protein